MANQRDQAAWKEVETMMRKETQNLALLIRTNIFAVQVRVFIFSIKIFCSKIIILNNIHALGS